MQGPSGSKDGATTSRETQQGARDRPDWVKDSFICNIPFERARGRLFGSAALDRVQRLEEVLLQGDTVMDPGQLEKDLAIAVKGKKRLWHTQDREAGPYLRESERVELFTEETESLWDSDESDEEPQGMTEQEMEQAARDMIQEQGMCYKVPSWMTVARPPSMQLVCDAQMEQWPRRDNKVRVMFKRDWNVMKITEAVRTQEIGLRFGITVFHLTRVREIQSLEPLRNRLAALCRAVKVEQPQGRIFFCNLLPNPHARKVMPPRDKDFNRLLEEAVNGINSRLGRVFYINMWERSQIQQVQLNQKPRSFLRMKDCLT